MIKNVGILTDNTVQFPVAAFPGHELIHVIPFQVRSDTLNNGNLRAIDLPISLGNGTSVEVQAPGESVFYQAYRNLSHLYQQMVVITMSSTFSPAYRNAFEAARKFGEQGRIEVIDSNTVGIGLGLLVQVAAAEAANNMSSSYIKKLLMQRRKQIYSVFCIKGLSYLAKSMGFDQAQARIGELLGVTPFFSLEEGRLFPMQKVRSDRHLIDCLYDFVTEFSEIEHIAIMQGVSPFEYESRSLRNRISESISVMNFSEHIIDLVTASLLGPHTLGMFVLESEN